MNRREAAASLVATLGALAGAGCAQTPAPGTIPPGASEAAHIVSKACSDLPIVLPERLYLRFGKQYLKTVGGPYTVTSSNRNLKATLVGDRLELESSVNAEADVTLTETVTGKTATFHVAIAAA